MLVSDFVLQSHGTEAWKVSGQLGPFKMDWQLRQSVMIAATVFMFFLTFFFLFDQFLTSSPADMDIFPFSMYSAVQL